MFGEVQYSIFPAYFKIMLPATGSPDTQTIKGWKGSNVFTTRLFGPTEAGCNEYALPSSQFHSVKKPSVWGMRILIRSSVSAEVLAKT